MLLKLALRYGSDIFILADKHREYRIGTNENRKLNVHNYTGINTLACEELTIEEITACRKRWKDHVLNSW